MYAPKMYVFLTGLDTSCVSRPQVQNHQVFNNAFIMSGVTYILSNDGEIHVHSGQT